ncbi:MAG: PKD domain-containing protein [candidate division Zixibacteria bacterium]|nr:PKD domain-containing protein [candidate division Zixibacteria bacterium]
MAFASVDIGGDEFWDTNKHADFTASVTSGCDTLTTQFLNTSTCIDEQWFWDFGDGNTSNNRDPVHKYAAPGTYNVRLIANGPLDADTLVRPGYIKVAPRLDVINFAADTTVGIDTLTVVFTAATNVTPDSLRWLFGDGGTAKGNPITHTYVKPGIFTVEVRGYNFCGADSILKPAMILVGSKSAPPAETLFVGIDPMMIGGLPGHDSTGNGTRFAPYREIRHAARQVYTQNSHVIFVGPSRQGFYSGPISTLYDWRIKILSEKGADSTLITGGDGFEVVDLFADTALQVFQGFTVANNVVGFCEGACPGAIYMYGRAWVINNKIFNNVGGGGGGGINYYGIPAYGGIIAGNWIGGNRDAGGVAGGGIQVDYSSSLSIVNNTIIGNTAQAGAGINLSPPAAGVTIANNIIAYNLTGFGINKESVSFPTTVVYNLFHLNALGNTSNLPPLDATNLTTNPFLYDYNKRNYHLTCGSPGRNRGSNGWVPTVLSSSGDFAWDGDVNPSGSRQGRIFQTTIDMGGDEFWDTEKHASFDATPKVGCNTLQVSFSNFSSCIDEQWIWSFGDGGSSNQKNPVHTYTGPGSYTVRLIAKGDLDSDTMTITDFIKVVQPLEISFAADIVQGCDSLTAMFTAQTNVSADSLRWIFGDGGTATGNPLTRKFTKVGVFDVELRAYNPCGMVASVKPAYITVGTKPEVIITSSSDSSSAPKCIPYEVRLHTLSDQPLSNWEWDFGDSDTTGAHLSDPVHTYTRTGSFSVRLISTSDCGSDTTIRRDFLNILTRPTALMDANPKAVCASGQSVNFTATYQGTVDSSRWLFGDGATAPGPNTSHLYPGAGVYQPLLILFHPCATDTLPLNATVGVGTPPQASFYGTPRTGFEPVATQFADSSLNLPTSWQWGFGDGATSTEKNPLHTYGPGDWDVSLTASNVCGTSQSAVSQYVRVGGFQPSLDSTGSSGDTIHFNVLVDSLVMRYDRPITLNASLVTPPRRGSVTFVFGASTGTPSFATTMTMIPSFDLPSGDYVVRLSAIDPRITKTAERTIHYIGHQFVDITPESLDFGRQIFGGPYGKHAYVHNRAPAGSGFALTFLASDSGGGYDPVLTRDRIPLRGKGTPDLILPRVAATVPALPFGEVRIDSMVRFLFSEAVIAPGADSAVTVAAKRFLQPVPGHLVYSSGSPTRPFTWVGFAPDSCVWFPADDTLRFRIRATITDTSENRLDGDADGNDEGSPADDYLFSVSTGPGVRPGDADQDRRVDERDILPLARFWGLTGPSRNNLCDGFVVQPASAWNPRAATHADADGNGVIDSADICPIAQYFDMVVAAPKLEVESWMNEARTWDKSIVRALLNGLIDCPSPGPGQSVLHRFLEDVQSESPVPDEYSLGQNYPNPFNPSTVIEYSLKSRAKVRLEIFDVTGRLVTVLEDSEQSAGHHTRIWDGTDNKNRALASGIYFYRLVTPEFRMARKMVLMK